MPRIATSSDIFQNQQPGLTTFKRDLDRRVVREAIEASAPAPARETNRASLRAEQRNEETVRRTQQAQETARAEAARPRELYAPQRGPEARSRDADSFVTGGTVDVRA